MAGRAGREKVVMKNQVREVVDHKGMGGREPKTAAALRPPRRQAQSRSPTRRPDVRREARLEGCPVGKVVLWDDWAEEKEVG